MKSSEVLDYALPRANLSISVAADRTKGLFYLNAAVDLLELEAEAWDWLFKTTTLTTVASQRLYSLASGTLEVYEFWNDTDNIPMEMISPEEAVVRDPDRDNTGSVREWYVEGVDDTTGLWVVGLYNIPSSAGETIRYSYYKSIDDLTDDSTNDMITAGLPKHVHPALMFWTAELLLSEQGLAEDEVKEGNKRRKAVSLALGKNGKVGGNKRVRMRRRDGIPRRGVVSDVSIDGV